MAKRINIVNSISKGKSIDLFIDTLIHNRQCIELNIKQFDESTYSGEQDVAHHLYLYNKRCYENILNEINQLYKDHIKLDNDLQNEITKTQQVCNQFEEKLKLA